MTKRRHLTRTYSSAEVAQLVDLLTVTGNFTAGQLNGMDRLVRVLAVFDGLTQGTLEEQMKHYLRLAKEGLKA